MNKLKAKDLVADKVYYSKHIATRDDLKYEIIWKCGVTAPILTNFPLNGALYVTEKSITKLGFISADGKEELRLATDEEKQWFNKCIEANKYIPKEKALKPIEMTKEQLLEKAKKDYPIGTKFIASNSKKECIITTGILKDSGSGINEYDKQGNLLTTGSYYHSIYTKDDKKWAEIISKPEVKVVDTFVLPEKWWIQSDHSKYKKIYDWFNKNGSRKYTNLNEVDIRSKLCFPSPNGIYHQTKGNSDYTEITFEQFKKYVLKENTEIKPEVIDTSLYTLKQIEDALYIFDKEDKKDILDAIKKIK